MTDTKRQAKEVREGLCEEEVLASRKKHGANILTKKKRKPFWRQFLANLNDPVIRILLVALGINLLMLFQNTDWVETLGIAIAVFLATLISTLSEYGSARAFEQLSEEASKSKCRVRRGGSVREIPICDVVVGDILLLGAGEMIPADGRLIFGSLRADQSAMTGESAEVEKFPSENTDRIPSSPTALFRGCTVTAGSGEIQVLAVGDASFLGEISREIQEETRESPLKRRLSKLARQISVLGYLAAVLVALAYLFNVFVLDSGMRPEIILLKLSDLPYLLSELLHAFTLGLTVIVVAVPEGLPMMIAVVLSSNIKKMIRDQVLVRKPVGIESAGSMNILFTDKTGTLTEGKMKAISFHTAYGESHPLPSFWSSDSPLSKIAALCCRFGGEATLGSDESGSRKALGGNPTDKALLSSVMHTEIPKGYRVSQRLPFDSTRKYAATSLVGKERLTFLWGAPEKLLPYVKNAMNESGSVGSFARTQVEKRLRELTAQGNRVLLLTCSQENISASSFAFGIKGTLTLLGLICLCDPIRREAAQSVAKLQDAGIQVVMITGDNRETAGSIAKGCGILNKDCDLILTSDELARISDLHVRELLPRLAVVARALPTDKSRLVRIAQDAGLVAGMTGDGINDAPALRRADVGFAMGSGTQVAKDAGDIIILDNNLASVVRAVLYGRNIFKSIRKFITLQLTMNFCAMGVTMICPFLGIDSPVTVVQMLWINMIMDTLGGLAFAGEPALEDYMKEPPKRRDEPILNRYMINQILLLGSYTVGMCLFFLKAPHITRVFRPSPDNLYLLTAFFALFIFSSVFNCFHARTDRLKLTAGLKQNPIFLVIMIAILVIQIAFVYVGGSVLRTAPLSAPELLVTCLISLSVFPAELIRKLLWRLRGKKNGY